MLENLCKAGGGNDVSLFHTYYVFIEGTIILFFILILYCYHSHIIIMTVKKLGYYDIAYDTYVLLAVLCMSYVLFLYWLYSLIYHHNTMRRQ